MFDEPNTATLSPLQQSLVSAAAGVADLERQLAFESEASARWLSICNERARLLDQNALTIDELTQQSVELGARVSAYEAEMHALRLQADVVRKSLVEAGSVIDQLRREVAELRSADGSERHSV